MVSLSIVVLTVAIVGTGLWMVFRFSAGGELKKETYHKIPAHHSDKKRRV
ncbi:hypothetical protein [Bdellovibrio svalbardensis]|uniref:Uncharacterized protein n=1 Tax=Bdellovibrio svalbardensis TaxID=2972972 RepID=A0ABT6DJY9_9BACT|nr:hypothetical protein [Bdellovibrio svalbardensis]MDG0817167.1 hypothetical protein [Bdellovibrio svalbardensis]